MVVAVTLIDKSDGSTIVQRGREYIMSFPTESCRDLAEAMQAQLNAPGAGLRTNEFKAYYRNEKRKRGIRFGGRPAHQQARASDLPESDGIRVEDRAEDIKRRIGYSAGLPVADEAETQISLLPMLVEQARTAEGRAVRSQREYGAAVVEARAAWGKVANALIAIGGQHLVDAVLAVSGEVEE